MKVAVFGAGGIGGYFGGRLAQAGADVVFIARGAHLDALQQRGLKVESLAGDFTLPAVRATGDPASVGEVDLVIIAVKSWQLDQALAALRPLVGRHTTLLPLLNGVEAADRAAELYGRDRVIGGLCSLISMVAGPAHIKHVGADPLIRIGELDKQVSPRVRAIQGLFAAAQGVTVEVPDDIHVALWNKFLLIAPWSGIGAVTRAPIGVTRSVPETRDLLLRSMREVLRVALARGIAMDEDAAIPAAMTFIDSLPYSGTASMQRDIMEGRRSELESQTGAVVRLGAASQTATPVNAVIYAALLPLEQKARGDLEF